MGDKFDDTETETKYGIMKADNKTIRKRRIINVSGRGKWAQKMTTVSTTASTVPKPTNPSAKVTNPFGGFRFGGAPSEKATPPVSVPPSTSFPMPPKPPPPMPPKSNTTNSNPFASISIANTSSKPTFPPIPAPTTNSFPLTSSNAMMNSTIPNPSITAPSSSSSNSTRPTSHTIKTLLNQLDPRHKQKVLLNFKFGDFLQGQRDTPLHETVEWTDYFSTYVQYATTLQAQAQAQTQAPTSLPSKSSTSSTSSTSALPFPIATTKDDATMASPAPATRAAPALSFSFGSATAASGVTASSTNFSGFSFPTATPNPTTTTTTTATTTTATIPEGESSETPPSEPTDEVGADETNKDETVVYGCKGKHYKYAHQKWTDHGIGKIQLYQHNTNEQQRRLVMRNNVGKVQLNFGISKGMPFEKIPKKKNKGAIRFFAVLEAGKDPVPLMFLVTLDNLDPLYSKLVEMAS